MTMRNILFRSGILKLAFAGFLLLQIHSNCHCQIIESASITDLMERWKIYNLGNREIKGWRIQLIATVDRRQVESMRRTFEYRYPEYPTHIANNEPYFHLKTGAFLTMQKAQAFLKKMQHDYPAAIIVSDLIKGEELLLYDQ